MVEGFDLISKGIPVSKRRRQPPINSRMWCSKYALDFVPPAQDKDHLELSFGTAIRFLLTDPQMISDENWIIPSTEDLSRSENPEMIDFQIVVRIRLDPRETIECLTVLLAIMVAPENPPGIIKTSGTEMSGEGDNETLHVEVHSVIKRVMVIGEVEVIDPKTGSTIAEAREVMVTKVAGLESAMTATGVAVKGNMSMTNGVEASATGMILVATT